MKMEKIKNWDNTYDIKLTKNDKTLTILFSRVLDLYMVMEDGKRIPFKTSKTIDFDVSADDSLEVYKIFDELYNDVINGNIFERKTMSRSIDSSLICGYNLLVYENKNIVWVSDDGRFDEVDRMQISKRDNSYRLTFTRTENQSIGEFKDPYAIYVRLRTSGSRYDPFYIPFIRMYRSLQGLDETREDKVVDNSQIKKRTRKQDNKQ